MNMVERTNPTKTKRIRKKIIQCTHYFYRRRNRLLWWFWLLGNLAAHLEHSEYMPDTQLANLKRSAMQNKFYESRHACFISELVTLL